MTWPQIGEAMGRHPDACRVQYRMAGPTARIEPSPYPIYNQPLHREGDALILSDTEFPYHHADFINRCLDLAVAWKIPYCVIAGDALHFASLSKWEANWIAAPKQGLSGAAEDKLMEWLSTLPPEQQQGGYQLLGEIGAAIGEEGGVSSELALVRKSMTALGEVFEGVDYVIGNHDDRLLRAINSPMLANDLLKFLGLQEPRWRIASYYYSTLTSGEQLWRIEHPKSAGKNTSQKLASKYLCNVTMGHSHRWLMEHDASGRYYAIQQGCCADERRMPYAAQRSTNQDAHLLGALIVRGGYPWILGEDSPWKQLERM